MGAVHIRKILHSRLPERWAEKFPPVLVELVVGLTVGVLLVAARLPFQSVVEGRAPYAFNFLAVVVAAVLAGWRSGLIALIVTQFLTWQLVVEPYAGIPDATQSYAFALATFSESLILAIIALYQREVAKGVAEREARMELLGQALEEIDHRTRNNYQTVLALVQLQAQRSKEDGVRDALQQVADRIQAVTRATEHLAHRSADLGTVRLREHLCELCEQVERGLSREGVEVLCEVEDIAASTEKAIYLSIIVNELVTNSLKHAFDETSSGRIRVASEQKGKAIEIIVEDNGHGFTGAAVKARSGLGSKLVERFARELGCKHDVISSDRGTCHRLLIPSLT